MAKKHIRVLARELVNRYSQAEKILADAGVATQDIVFSPEEQKVFSAHKAEVDNYLSLLSVSFSAAAQGKIQSLVAKAQEEYDVYVNSLHEATFASHDSSLAEQEKKQNAYLADIYANRAAAVLPTIQTLDKVRFIANIPVRKSGRAKYFVQLSRDGVSIDSVMSDVFSSLDAALDAFTHYVATFTSQTVILSDPATDLLE